VTSAISHMATVLMSDSVPNSQSMIVLRGSIVTTEEILDTHFSSFSASGRRCTAMASILPEWKRKKRENGFDGSTEASMRRACAPLVIAHNLREAYRYVARR